MSLQLRNHTPWDKLAPSFWDRVLLACDEVDDESSYWEDTDFRSIPDSQMWRMVALLLRNGIPLRDITLILNQGGADWSAKTILDGMTELIELARLMADKYLPKLNANSASKPSRRKAGAA